MHPRLRIWRCKHEKHVSLRFCWVVIGARMHHGCNARRTANSMPVEDPHNHASKVSNIIRVWSQQDIKEVHVLEACLAEVSA